MLTTRFTEMVGCSVPIQQAGMGGVAMPPLAAAVAEAGGLGMLGGGRIPAAVLAGMLEETRQITSGAFGVNFLMPFLDLEAVKIASKQARVLEFFYDTPDPSLVGIAHEGGSLAAWQVGSRDEAIAAAQAGCDFIIAQGTEAGGHVRGRIGLLPLLSEVLDAVDVPVVAAGGIATGRTMAACLAAGAAAVRVGTRFVAAEECSAHPDYVRALIAAGAGDTVLTETFSVMWPNAPHRVLRSSVEAANAFPEDIVALLALRHTTVSLPRFAVPTPTRGTTGAIEAMALYAGESVGAVQRVQPAAEIVQELASEAEAYLKRWSR